MARFSSRFEPHSTAPPMRRDLGMLLQQLDHGAAPPRSRASRDPRSGPRTGLGRPSVRSSARYHRAHGCRRLAPRRNPGPRRGGSALPGRSSASRVTSLHGSSYGTRISSDGGSSWSRSDSQAGRQILRPPGDQSHDDRQLGNQSLIVIPPAPTYYQDRRESRAIPPTRRRR